ncbi:MAG: coenzyme F420 hydrogenase/dehydrogenase beta subunit N-terminal domain-containing protein [Limisphaerales bacterium]
MPQTNNDEISIQRIQRIIQAGLCTGCGACVGLDSSGKPAMKDSPAGPIPQFEPNTHLPSLAFDCCPGKGLDYPQLYQRFYGAPPKQLADGPTIAVRTGHATDESTRRNGASGGVLTQVLIYLLEQKLIDAAIVVRQGVPTPSKRGQYLSQRARAYLKRHNRFTFPWPRWTN